MAWTHEQTNQATGGGPLAFTNNVKAGSLLIAVKESEDVTAYTPPTDTLGNTWTLLTQTLSANNQRVGWWYAISNGAGACTVTFSGGALFAAVRVSEFSVVNASVDPSPAVASVDDRTGSPGTDVLVSPSVSVTKADSLVLGVFGSDNGGNGTVTAGTGYTLRGTVIGLTSTGGANDRFALESKEQGVGTTTAAFTVATNAMTGVVSVAAFSFTPLSTNTNVTRDIRMTSQASTLSTIPVTVLLPLNISEASRDLRIIGSGVTNVARDIRIASNSSNTTRDTRITGQSTSLVSRDIRLTSTSTSSAERSIAIFGGTGSSSTIPVTILLGTSDNATRDLRLTGAGVVSSTAIDIRITGTSTNTTRDLRIVGSLSPRRGIVTWANFQTNAVSTTTRDIRISGLPPGGTFTELSRDLRLVGQASPSIATDLRVTAQATTNVTRDIRLTGRATSSVANDLRVSGTGVPQTNTTRDIRLDGALPWVGSTVTYKAQELDSSREVEIRLTGQLTSNNFSEIRISGQVVNAFANRDLRIRAQDTSNVTRDLAIRGEAANNTTRDLRLTGTATSSLPARDLRIRGELPSSVSADLRLRGQASTNDTRELRVTGKLDSVQTRDVWIKGQADTFRANDLRITGQLSNNVTRDIVLAAESPNTVDRALAITGSSSNEATADLAIFGEVRVQTNINAAIQGEATSSGADTNLRIAGRGADSVAQDIRIEGGVSTLSIVTGNLAIAGRAAYVARPDGDISTGDWIAVPSGTLYSTIDEAVPDESDYMKSPSDLTNAIGNAASFNTAQNAITGLSEHYPLTNASAPFTSASSASTLNTSIGSFTVATANPAFAGESYIDFASGGGVRGYVVNGADYNDMALSGWFRIDSLPASTVLLLAYGDNFNNNLWNGIALKSDGTITWLKAGTEYGNPSQVLAVGQWYHLAVLYRPATITTKREFAINGVVVLSESTLGYSGSPISPGIRIAGDGFDGAVAHIALYNQIGSLSSVAALYPYRATNHTAEVSLSNVTDPNSNRYHIVRYRIASKQLPSPLELTVTLLQGSTEIASWIHTNIGSPKTFEHELSATEADSITDYNDLRLRFTAADKGFVARDIRIGGV